MALTAIRKTAMVAVLFACVLALSPSAAQASIQDIPPVPPTPFIVYVLKFLAVVGPLGAVAWKFSKVRDPISGFEAVTWVILAFFALIILWYATDVVGEVITAL